MTLPTRIPLFPLNTVLFPEGRLPLRVFEARYMDMTRDCMKSGAPFGVCLIREGREVGAPATPESVGCLARIVDWDMEQLGMLHLQTRGGERFRILTSTAGPQGLLSADYELLPPEPEQPIPTELRACAQLLRKIVAERGEEVFNTPHCLDDASWVGFRIAEMLPIDRRVKQQMLESTDAIERLTTLHELLDRHGVLKNLTEE